MARTFREKYMEAESRYSSINTNRKIDDDRNL